MLAALPAALLVALSSQVPTDSPAGFALVVTNNHSLELSRPDLHYADDDGVKYAQLFSEAYGPKNVVLLTQLDVETKALYPQWEKQTSPPTRENVLSAVEQIAQAMAVAKREGRKVEALVVFAGHGDVERGQGFVELLDAKLTARDLDERIIQKLPADRIHVILDSCNSYFMLNPRKPGGARWAAPKDDSNSLFKKYPNVGAIISTSAEAVTYEWSELQSGIFSYEVRSGLRGAADADGDGRVSYAELSAFISVANEPVVNDLYRPKVFARAPNQDAAQSVMSLPKKAARRLRLAAAGEKRITIRDTQGVRVLDLHKEDQTALALMLPEAEQGLGVYEAIEAKKDGAADARPVLKYTALGVSTDAGLDELAEVPLPLAARGEAPVFSALFSKPFGQKALAQRAQAPKEEEPSGVTKRDAERLRLHLMNFAEISNDGRRGLASGIVFMGVISTAISWMYASLATMTPSDRFLIQTVSLSVTGSSLAVGTAVLMGPTPHELLLGEFLKLDLSTEQGRTAGVLETELKYKNMAEDSAFGRKVGGAATIGIGALSLIVSGFFLAADLRAHQPISAAATSAMALGVIGVGFGVYEMVWSRSPIERGWKLYRSEPDVDQRHEPKQETASLQLTAGPAGQGFGLGLAGSF